MSENLKVNAKTSILEFKRKHNKLVDSIPSLLEEQDISVKGITSKGIANTGGIANIGDVDISGNLNVQGEGKGKITANTLEQRNPNWIGDFSFENVSVAEGIEITDIYNKLIKVNGLLYLVCNFKLHNTTENAITVNTLQKYIILPTEIAEKIYDYGGAKVSEEQSTASNRDVTTDIGFSGINNVVGGVSKTVYIRHTGENQINIEIPYNISIAPNSYNAFTFRTFLVLF